MVNLEMGDMPENGVNQDELDMNDKLKYVNSPSEDVSKNEIESIHGKNFAGLTKAELLQYADDPFWVKLRSALLLLFWVVWFGMLGSAILIIVLSPKCPVRPETSFLDGAAVYEVDATFAGDKLSAISDKFDYIKNTVKSKAIVIDNDLVKNLDELKVFVRNAHKNELKVIIGVKASANITQNLKQMMTVKVDGIKLTASDNSSSASITSMLTNKAESFGKYQDTLFIAERALGLDENIVDMTVDEFGINEFNMISNKLQGFSINFGKFDTNFDMKPLLLSALARKGTPFIKAGQELGLNAMDWTVLKEQQAIGQGVTTIDIFSKVNGLREKESMMFGDIKLNNKTCSSADSCSVSFTRSAPGFPTFYIAMHKDNGLIDFGKDDISGIVVANTENQGELKINSEITFGNIFLKQGQGIIIQSKKQ